MKRLLLAFSLLLLYTPPSWAATAFVQSAACGTGAGLTITCTFGSNVTAGNLIAMAYVTSTQGANLTSLTVSNSGTSQTWVSIQQISDVSSTSTSGTYYAKNISGSTTNSVTLTITTMAGAFPILMVVHEISGADTTSPLDGNNGQIQLLPTTTTDAVKSGSFTTTSNGDYIFGAAFDFEGFGVTFTQGTGYTIRINNDNSGTEHKTTEDQIQSSAGTLTNGVAFTASANNPVVSFGAAFKPASGGSGATYRSLGETGDGQ